MNAKKVLIVGANSQDSIILSKLLLSSRIEIYATSRKNKLNLGRYAGLFPDSKMIYVDSYSKEFFCNLFEQILFDQIYIFASISNIGDKRYSEKQYIDSSFGLVENLINAVISTYKGHECIVFNSSSVEMFGKSLTGKQNEDTFLHPESAYAIGKAKAHDLIRLLRNSGDLLAINGIMYNHESIYRAESFVTQKICKGVSDIFKKRSEKIVLGDVNVYRDWSYAGDIVSSIKYGMDNKLAGDYILASGRARPLSDWLEASFRVIGIDNWIDFIDFDPSLKRDGREYIPNADISKARDLLNLSITLPFNELVSSMVEHHNNNECV